VFALPPIDLLFVTLQGPALRLLVAPTELPHQATNVIAVVPDPEFAPNQSRDAIAGPQVRGVTVGHRPFQEKAKEAPLLSGREPRWPSGRRPDLEDLLSNPVSCIAPSHDGAGLAVDPARDFVER
jgi:hypothetical protein